MSGFPCLEVLDVAVARATLVVGQTIELMPGLVMGPGAGPLRVAAPRDQFRIERKSDRWWLFDLGCEPRTMVDAQPVYDTELVHGSLIEAHGLTFAVWLHDPRADVHAALEADVLEDPEDEPRWNVWADWLLERGVELGRRVAGELDGDVQSDARALGGLVSAWRRGFLEVEWRRGVARKAVVRRPAPVPTRETPAALVTRVLEHHSFRFLTHLEVDVTSFGRGGELEPLMSALARGPAPVWLESVRLGPFDAAPVGLAPLWDAVRAARPRLTTPLERALMLVGNASLHVRALPAGVRSRPAVGGSVGLSTLAQNVVGQLDEAVVQLTAPEDHDASGLALLLEVEDGRWVASGTSTHGARMRVNGRELSHALLRDGDVIALSGVGLEFHQR